MVLMLAALSASALQPSAFVHGHGHGTAPLASRGPRVPSSTMASRSPLVGGLGVRGGARAGVASIAMSSAGASEPAADAAALEVRGGATATANSPLPFTVGAALSSLLHGYDTGVIAGALLLIVPHFGLENAPATVGAIVTACTVGAFLGTVVVSPWALDTQGRAGSLRASSILFIVAGVMLAYSPSVSYLIAGRFLAGIGMGVASAAVPLYVSETTPPESRGAMATIPQLFISSGILLSYVVDLIILLAFKGGWRWMMGASLLPALAQSAAALWLPESPRWLLRSKGADRVSKAKASLERLRGAGVDVGPELNGMIKAVEDDKKAQNAKDTGKGASGGGSFIGMLKNKPARKAAFVCVVLQAMQQMCGINAIVYFTPTILREAGVSTLFSKVTTNTNAASMLSTVIAYTPKIPALLVAMKLMDSLGRRSLLTRGIPAMGASLFGLAMAFMLAEGSPLRGLLAVAAVMTYGVVFVMSLGPIPSIISSEIFPAEFRAVGMSTSVSAQWAFNALVSTAFPILQHQLGTQAVLYLFTGVCVAAQLFTIAFVPETKGKSMEEMEELMS